MVALPRPPPPLVGHDRVFGERAYIRRAAHRLDKEEPAA